MDQGWRARIDSGTGEVLGAGFLIDATRVLTCAHVVDGMTAVRVTVPGRMNDLPGTVEPLTDWAEQGDEGDMALVRLESPVRLTPATFPEPDGCYWSGDLRALGFGYGFDKYGSYVTLHTSDDLELGAEWWQLNVDPGQPELLAEGFSGAAVYRASTDEVIGMITDADLGRGGRMGQMLPLESLRRHWDDLDELLPLSWLNPRLRRKLRDIVRDAEVPLQQVYHEAFGGKGPWPHREFRSAWGAIRYVAEQRVYAAEQRLEDDRLPVFLRALAPQLPVVTARQLSAWVGQTFPNAAPSPASERGPTSIIIRLDRYRDTYGLTLATLVDGVPGHTTESVEVREAEVRAEVENRLPMLLPYVSGKDLMIEFALPERWLGKAVEEWRADRHKMLIYPVVVRDVNRLDPHGSRRHDALRRWDTLRNRGALDPEPMGCDSIGKPDQFFYWLATDADHCVLVFGRPPSSRHLTKALDAGIPVMLWSHSRCPAPNHNGVCPGGQVAAELAADIGSVSPDGLPEKVRSLRGDALAKSAEDQPPYWGRRLTLFWDDPKRLPDPPLGMLG
jgi:hypothetical protein